MLGSVRPLAIVSLVALLVATACSSGGNAPGTGASGSTINVMSLWGGSEQDSFQKVLDAFKTKTGVTAKYESIRTDYATTLQTRISGGNPPDIAIIPGIGFLRQFARQGSLKKVADLGVDVNALKSNYPPGILEIGQVDGTQYAIMVKFNSKSTVWFRPDKFKTAGVSAATDWNSFTKLLTDLKAKGQTPLGLGAGDSWTLTDWFESVYVRQAGPDKYDQLFSGKLPWTDSSVSAPVKSVPATAYPNELAKREAAQVANATAVRFDGSDLLPSGGGDDMGAALQDALRGKTVDWAKFETSIQAKWKAEK